MKNIFEHSSSHWVKYDGYEIRPAADGVLYITPNDNAEPRVYDPLINAKAMVIDALNVGLLCMNRESEDEIRKGVTDFVSAYGLLGLMTALPTTPKFVDYEAVYLPKNHFIKDEAMATEAYLSLFFPFDKPDFHKRGIESNINITDRKMMALALTFHDQPTAQVMSFGRDYAERYDWVKQQFKDWAFTFCSSFLYYEDYDKLDPTARELYRQGMAALDGIAPGYHIELRDRPTIVWDFHSLSLAVQMMLSFMLTDETAPLRICRCCGKAFAADRTNMVFCSPKCKNRYNVRRSRGKGE